MAIQLTPAEQQVVVAHSSAIGTLVNLALRMGNALRCQPHPMPDDVANPYRLTADLLLDATIAWVPLPCAQNFQSDAIDTILALQSYIEAIADEDRDAPRRCYRELLNSYGHYCVSSVELLRQVNHHVAGL